MKAGGDMTGIITVCFLMICFSAALYLVVKTFQKA